MIDLQAKNCRIKIGKHGAVMVRDASIAYENEAVACISVDLVTKYAEVSGTVQASHPQVWLVASPSSVYVAGHVSRDEITIVVFHDYPGWRVFSALDAARYTLQVVLVAPNVPEL